eukprot:1005570-Pleurochrysis_carterae.AAC.2
MSNLPAPCLSHPSPHRFQSLPAAQQARSTTPWHSHPAASVGTGLSRQRVQITPPNPDVSP